MDIDLDLFDDGIQTFLHSKLEEIRLYNSNLQNTLDDRLKLFHSTFESTSEVEIMDDIHVKIDDGIWKKIFNNKYSIGFRILHNGTRSLKLDKLLLQWDSTNPILYKVVIFDEPFNFMEYSERRRLLDFYKEPVEFKDKTIVIVMLDVPDFLDKSCYKTSGKLFLNDNDKDIVLNLPDFAVSQTDSAKYASFDWEISSGKLENILTIVSCSVETELSVIFPEDTNITVVETHFEIYCSLTKIILDNKSDGRFFYCHKISPMFDGSMIGIRSCQGSKCFLSIYSRSDECLIALLHHLQANVHNIVILPDTLVKNYELLMNNNSNEEIDVLSQKLSDNLVAELGLTRKFLREIKSQGKNVTNAKILEFRKRLSAIEIESDELYIHISNSNING